MKTYATVREAAIAALKVAVPMARETGWEYGGYILKSGDGYYFTDPFTSREKGSLDGNPEFARLTGLDPTKPILLAVGKEAAKKAGIVSHYHVHPCDDSDPDSRPYVEYFSETDIATFMTSGMKTAYMGVTCSGNVREANMQMRIGLPAYPLPIIGGLGPIIGKV